MFATMKKICIICIILLHCIPPTTYAHSRKTQDSIIRVFFKYVTNGQYDSLANVAGDVFSARTDNSDHYLTYYSGLQCAQAAIFLDDYRAAAAYLDTLSSFDNWDSYPELFAIFNTVNALYDIKDGFNYTSALIHLNDAMNYYKSIGDDLNTCITLNNISVIYFFRRDTTGLRYTKEGENISARHKDNQYMTCIAYVGQAMMMLLQENYDNAEWYAIEAKKIIDTKGYAVFNSRIYMVLSEVALSRGNIADAKDLLEKGFRATNNIISDYYFELSLTYGKLLIATEQWKEAETFLKETLKKVNNNNNIRYRYQFLFLLYSLYEAQGNINESHKYFKRYVASKDSIVNIGKESSFNNLLSMYAKASFDSVLRKKQIDVYIILFVCIVTILIGCFFLNRYVRQKKMNRNLVELNQEYQKRNEMLRKYLETKHSNSNNSADDLFWKLEKLMREEHIYRSHDISLDRLASLLGTNRTYISQIINKFTDKSFWDYINMYRITEATQILSDMEADVQIKAIYEDLGYNSAASFFRVFRKEMGVTPLKYREEVCQMKNKSKDTEPSA